MNGNRKAKQTTQQKSYKMGADELMEKIKSCVKEALEEQEGKELDIDEPEATAEEAGFSDIASLVADALEMVEGKRKSSQEAGEEVGEITAEEIMEAISELVAGEKAAGEEEEEKEGEEKPDEKAAPTPKARKAAPPQRKAAGRQAAPVQRKYSDIFLAGGSKMQETQKKTIPPEIQLARAVKCLDVFGRSDPEAAAYHARKKYGDADMEREFKALTATSPVDGALLIPEVYLAQLVEMLYSKTVIYELGAQKVPMAQGNLTIPKMTAGTRATWGGEQRKIAKTQPKFGNIKLSAKRLEAIIPTTRELLMSTNYSADQMFANDLTRRMELGLDYGGLFGSGGEFQPQGIFTDKEVERVDAKTLGNADLSDNTGKITADFPVYLRSIVLAKNVDDNSLGWTFNSVLGGYLMNMKTTTGTYIYRDEMEDGKLLGFTYKVSNQIPTDNNGYTKLLFGNFSDLLIGEQLGLETYTTLDGSWTDDDGVQHNAFEENLAATRALMFVDIAARHKESFVWADNVKAF